MTLCRVGVHRSKQRCLTYTGANSSDISNCLASITAQKGETLMCNFCKKSVKLFSTVVGVLFVVYFWNLDQKVLGWAYKQVNAMFDRKPVDIKF